MHIFGLGTRSGRCVGGRGGGFASGDKTVKLWDARSGQNLATLKGHEDSVLSVAFSPNGKTLASAGGDSDGKNDFAIRLWRAATDADVERQRNR